MTICLNHWSKKRMKFLIIIKKWKKIILLSSNFVLVIITLENFSGSHGSVTQKSWAQVTLSSNGKSQKGHHPVHIDYITTATINTFLGGFTPTMGSLIPLKSHNYLGLQFVYMYFVNRVSININIKWKLYLFIFYLFIYIIE